MTSGHQRNTPIGGLEGHAPELIANGEFRPIDGHRDARKHVAVDDHPRSPIAGQIALAVRTGADGAQPIELERCRHARAGTGGVAADAVDSLDLAADDRAAAHGGDGPMADHTGAHDGTDDRQVALARDLSRIDEARRHLPAADDLALPVAVDAAADEQVLAGLDASGIDHAVDAHVAGGLHREARLHVAGHVDLPLEIHVAGGKVDVTDDGVHLDYVDPGALAHRPAGLGGHQVDAILGHLDVTPGEALGRRLPARHDRLELLAKHVPA